MITNISKFLGQKKKKNIYIYNAYAPIKSKLQHPPPSKPRAFDYFLCPGSGEFDLYLGGVGKIEPEVSDFQWFSFFGRRSH